MNTAERAAFKFIKYKITKFSFEEQTSDEKLDLKFDASGRYLKNEATFELSLKVLVLEADKQIVDATMTLYFQFEKNTALKDFPSYFYRNAIAIGFPFLRSFVSTLTLQANCRLLMLPIMNLSNLEPSLIEKTVEIE